MDESNFAEKEIMRKLFAFAWLLLLACSVKVVAQATTDDRGYIVKVGDTAPEFEFELATGEKVKSKKLQGNVIMLQFTASWCGVCRKEMPFIESEIWQVYKNKGLKLYGVDLDEPLEKVKAFAEATGITYPLALDPGGEIFKLFAQEKSGVTRNVIIDQNGKIVFLTRLFDRAEFDEMKAVIASLLNEK